MKRKLLSYILMITLVASLFPVFPVYAAETQLQTETFAVTRAAAGITPQVLVGSDKGKTLTSGIYYLTKPATFTNYNTVGGHGLTIADGATVVIDTNGHTLTATGTVGSTNVGSGAGIYLPKGATLVFIGSGNIVAKGGNAQTHGVERAGTAAEYSYNSGDYGNGTIRNGSRGGYGGNGGAGGGAGIGTAGGKGGMGGADMIATETASFWGNNKSPAYYKGNPGGNGTSSTEPGALYILGKTDVTATGGNAVSKTHDKGGSYGMGDAVIVVRRNDGTTSFSDWAVTTAGIGAGGGQGGTGRPGVGYGTGGGGGGGGGSGTPGTIFSMQVNNVSPGNMDDDTSYIIYFGSPGYGGEGNEKGTRGSDIDNTRFVIKYHRSTGSGNLKYWSNYHYNLSPARFRIYVSGEGGGGGFAGEKARSSDAVQYSAATSNVSTKSYQSYLNTSEYVLNISLIDNAGGTTNAATAIVANNAKISGTAHTRTGYTLNGYYTAPSGGSKVLNADLSIVNSTVDGYIINGLWNTAANTKLYAQWSANTYKVTLNNNGGSGGTASVNATYDSAFPSFTKPTRTGYTFNGFYTEASGGEQIVDAGGTLVSNVSGYTGNGGWQRTQDTTLYAQWSANKYAVTLGANNGNGGNIGVSATYNAAFPSFTKHTRTGYTLQGYYTSASGGTKILNADGTVVNNVSGYTGNGVWQRASTTTLQAQWKANDYNVTLNDNSGSGGTSGVIATYDSAFPSFTKPTKNGYVLTGYYTAANGGTQVLAADGTVVSNVSGYTGNGVWQRTEDTTLYAQWIGANYGVLLHANGGSGETLDIKAQYDSPFPNFISHTRTGYSLTGYYTATSGGTKVLNTDGTVVSNVSGYTGSGVWLRNESTELYAQWNANQYNVTLNPNGGSGGTASVNATYDAAFPSFTKPTKDDYVLTGYYTAADGGTKVLNADGSVVRGVSGYTGNGVWQRTQNTTLYAQWILAKGYLAPRTNSNATHWSNCKTIAFGLPSGYSIDANNNLVTANGTSVAGADVSTEGSIGRVYFYSVGDTGYFINVNSPKSDIYITDAKNLFYNCTNLTNFDFTNAKLDTSECTTMESMFQYCHALNNFTWPSEFDTSNVTSMRSMFNGCSALTDLDLTNLNTENVVDMSYMFYNCRELSSLVQPDIFVTAKVGAGASSSNQIGVRSMFVNCNSLTTLDLSTWDLSGFTYYWGAQGIFGWPNESVMQNLKVLYLPKKVSNTILTNTHFDVLNLYSDENTHETKLRAATSEGECLRTRYTITYEANGGTGKTQQHYLHDISGNAQISLSDGADITKRYYTLNSWNTNATGVGASYALGAEHTIANTDLTLYAVWSKNTGNAYIGGRNFQETSTDSWRRKWLLKYGEITAEQLASYGADGTSGAPTLAENAAFSGGWFDGIKNIYIGKLPEGYHIDEDNGFALEKDGVLYEPLDVSWRNSPVPVYGYYLDDGSIYMVNGYDPDADVYLRDDQAAWLFRGCTAASVIDAAKLNATEAQDISGMFYNCSSITEVDLGGLSKAENLTNVWAMLYGAKNISIIDLSGFDLSGVTASADHTDMFGNNDSLKIIILPDAVSSAYPTKLKKTNYFYGDDTDTTAYDALPAANAENGLTSVRARYEITYHSNDATNATATGYMLQDIPATAADSMFTRNGYGFTDWATEDETIYTTGAELPVNTPISLYAQWHEATPFLKTYGAAIVGEGGDERQYTDLREIYISGLPEGYSINENYELSDGVNTYTGIDVSNKELGSGTVYLYTVGDIGYIINPYIPDSKIFIGGDASYLFYNCINLEKVDLSYLVTEDITNAKCMFQYCRSLKELDLSTFDTLNVTDMSSMFNRCFELESLDISGFDTSNVTNMSYMFYDCNKLESITFPENFVTEKVTAINGMFHTSGETYTNGAYSVSCEAPKLTSLDMSTWDLSGVTNAGNMLNMTTLREIILPEKVSSAAPSLTGLNLFKTADDTAEQTALTASEKDGDAVRYRYTVTYKSNYEGGTDNTAYFLYNDSYTVDYSNVTKDNYTLESLTTAQDGTGTRYADNSSYKVNADLELWAQWTATTYSVALSDNEGSGGKTSIDVTYGSEMPTLSTLPTREGYTFTGYFDSASGGEKYYNPDGTSAKVSDLTDEDTLYAQWEVNTYNISYNLNGGDWADGYTAPDEYTYGTLTILPGSDDIVLDGMAFDGWYTKPDYSGDIVESITDSDLGDKEFYAKWVETSFTVIARTASTMNDVDAEDDDIDVYANDTVTIEVIVDGGSFTNADWTLIYDSSKFEYVSETLHDNAQKVVTGNNVLGGIIRGAAGETDGNEFADGTVVVTYVFKAIPQVRAEVTGKFMITDAYVNTYTMAGDMDKRIANKEGTEVTILHVDDEAAGTEVPTGSVEDLKVPYNAMTQSGNPYVLDSGFSKAMVTYAAADADGNVIDDETDNDGNGVADAIENLSYRTALPSWTNVGEYTYYVKISGYGLATIYDSATLTIEPKAVTPSVTFAVDPSVDKVTITPVINGVLDETYKGTVVVTVNGSDYTFDAEQFSYDGETTAVCKESFDVTAPSGGTLAVTAVYTAGEDDNYANGEGDASIDVDKITADDGIIEQLEQAVTSIFPYDAEEHFVEFAELPEGWTHSTPVDTFDGTENPSVTYVDDEKLVKIVFTDTTGVYNDVTVYAALKVVPANVRITIDDKTKALGEDDPEFTKTVEIVDEDGNAIQTGLYGTDEADMNIELSREPGEKMGTYPITASYVPNKNYHIEVVDGKLEIGAPIIEPDDPDIEPLVKIEVVDLSQGNPNGDTQPDYIAGKRLILVYTNVDKAYYGYGTVGNYEKMFDVTEAGYKYVDNNYDDSTFTEDSTKYDHVYGIVVDKIGEYEATEAYEKLYRDKVIFLGSDESFAPKNIVYDADINLTDELDVNDYSMNNGIYNTAYDRITYLISILKADYNHDKIVDTSDSLAVRSIVVDDMGVTDP